MNVFCYEKQHIFQLGYYLFMMQTLGSLSESNSLGGTEGNWDFGQGDFCLMRKGNGNMIFLLFTKLLDTLCILIASASVLHGTSKKKTKTYSPCLCRMEIVLIPYLMVNFLGISLIYTLHCLSHTGASTSVILTSTKYRKYLWNGQNSQTLHILEQKEI